jgi:hypothetical protein
VNTGFAIEYALLTKTERFQANHLGSPEGKRLTLVVGRIVVGRIQAHMADNGGPA